MPSEPKWTPGPWEIEDLPLLLGGLDTPQRLPNKRLAAAAPDLYTALENLVGTRNYPGSEHPLLLAARKALAKARGESPDAPK